MGGRWWGLTALTAAILESAHMRHRLLLQGGNVCAYGFGLGIVVWVATGRFAALPALCLFAALALWALHAAVNPAARFPRWKDPSLPVVMGVVVLLFLLLLVIFAAVN